MTNRKINLKEGEKLEICINGEIVLIVGRRQERIDDAILIDMCNSGYGYDWGNRAREDLSL